MSIPDPENADPLASQPRSHAFQALIADLTSGDDQRAETSVIGLSQYGGDVLPAISPLVDSPDVDIRWWVVRLLAEIKEGEASDLIIKALKDEDSSVRQCAAMAISQHSDKRAVPTLIVLLSDPDSLLARLAANALISIGPPAVPALLDILRDGTSVPRFEAVRALALIADPRAIPGLMSVLEEDSALLDYWADEGLRRMGLGMVFFSP